MQMKLNVLLIGIENDFIIISLMNFDLKSIILIKRTNNFSNHSNFILDSLKCLYINQIKINKTKTKAMVLSVKIVKIMLIQLINFNDFFFLEKSIKCTVTI